GGRLADRQGKRPCWRSPQESSSNAHARRHPRCSARINRPGGSQPQPESNITICIDYALIIGRLARADKRGRSPRHGSNKTAATERRGFENRTKTTVKFIHGCL